MISPSFNFEGEKTPLYCNSHKLDGMYGVKNKFCLIHDCFTTPIYNYKGTKSGIYCSQHKLENMINVVNPLCAYPDCTTIPKYNFENETKGKFCSKHKETGMVDVCHPRCKTPLCFTSVKDKYDGYCLFCYMNLFPDKPVSRNYKTKEYSVVEHVKTNFPHLTWVSDKTIQDGCSKRRPDLFLDLGYQIIIIEIDENQHIDYDCSCENKRIMELSQDVNHRPIIFIRFNPDEYTIEDPDTNAITKISSCWGINQNGICTVKKSKKKEWDRRLETLSQQIHYWTNPINKTDKTIEVVQLFYDKVCI
jgi:hypothetical protein